MECADVSAGEMDLSLDEINSIGLDGAPSCSVGRNVADEIRALGDRLASNLKQGDCGIRTTSGADEAIRLIARSSTNVLVPARCYPGYDTLARKSQQVSVYDQHVGIESSALHGATVFVCLPRNPIEPDWFTPILNGASHLENVVVDATYSSIASVEFADLARHVVGRGGRIVFSCSKSLGLAGVRLGGVIGPIGTLPTSDAVSRIDVFQAAVWEHLQSAKGWSWAQAVHAGHSDLRNQLVALLRQEGFRVEPGGAETFVCVRADAGSPLRGLTGKWFDDWGLMRIDVSTCNINALQALGGPR